MPNFVHTHALTVDLAGSVEKRYGGALLGQGDDSADVFTVALQRNGQAAGLDATGCEAHFIRPDGTTVSMSGSVSGGVGTVTLLPQCYAVPGDFTLAIKFTGSGAEATAVIIDGSVVQTYTDSVADLGGVWNLSAIQALIDAKLDAPASEGQSGQALITDGHGGRSWGSVQAASANAIKIGDTVYTVRTGSTGASGFITLVLE